LVSALRTVEKALGEGIKRVCVSEEAIHTVSPKSIVAVAIFLPYIFRWKKHFAYRRPGTVILPVQYQALVGCSLKDTKKDGQQIMWEDVRD